MARLPCCPVSHSQINCHANPNGFVVTPLIFCLMGITISVIALIAKILVRLMRQKSLKAFPKVFKKFLWFTTSIVCQSDKSNYEIYPPNLIHSIRVDRENRRYSPPVRNLKAQGYWEDNPNNLRLHMPKQPITTRVNKVLSGFHSVVLFHRRFYGCSTKVEKNLGFRWVA